MFCHISRSIASFILFLACVALAPLFGGELFAPYAVYLTWQHDPTTTMTVHWLAKEEDKKAMVYYCADGQTQCGEAIATIRELPDPKLGYSVYIAEIKGLKPDTKYKFHFGKESKEYGFKTAPSHLNSPIQFVIGGDMYNKSFEEFANGLRQAAKLNPLFAGAGGDLAYAADRFADVPEKGEKWLVFVKTWSEEMVSQDGLLIPMLPAIGNHDVSGRHGQSPENAKYYYTLFAFPGPEGYNVLDFGNYLSLFLLDSGHTHPIEGKQAAWLERELACRTEIPTRFAVYHVPAFPSKRNFKNEVSQKVRDEWVPIFDRYHLTTAFEHHEHVYKRSHPIMHLQVDPEGTLYLGDGAWGVTPRIPYDAEELWYLAKTESRQHFIFITLDKNERTYRAIDTQGVQFDSVTQKLVYLDRTQPAAPIMVE